MVAVQARQDEILQGASALFVAIQQRGVRYCHWKSNRRLREALSGKTDLDLLVDGKQRDQFRAVLDEYDVKQLLPAPEKDYPGIEHYLGFDEATGRLFHLHVHYQLVLGEQHVKNYRLPLESHFLERTRTLLGVVVPAAELELIVLSLRALLKYRDRDGVKDVLGIRTPGLPGHILSEFEWLLAQTSLERVEALLTELGDVVPGNEIAEFVRTITENPRAGVRLLALRQRVRRALGIYQRRSRLDAMLTYFAGSWKRTLSYFKLKRKQKMSLPQGGMVVAFVGADGAGKTTVVNEMTRWLSWRLNVRTHYMGSSRPSVPTLLLKSLTRTTRRVDAGCRRLLGEERWLSRLVAGVHHHLLAVRYVAEGADRYRRFLAGRDDADRGYVVIYDRYPLLGVDVGERVMDGPRVSSLFPARMSRVARHLTQMEANLYASIDSPERLFILHVSPEVSQARKPEHKPASIHAKSRALAGLMQTGTANGEITHVQADLPLEQVLCEVKTALWRLL